MGLLVTAPLMLAIAVAVKLTSRGPVIYQQTRVGLDRRRRLLSGLRRRGFDRRRGIDRRRDGRDGWGGRRNGVDRRSAAFDGQSGRRLGDLGGKPFVIYKYRTMASEYSGADVQVWATLDDPRVTRVGQALRKFRLDELPQLVNVLMGHMNIVGPRPEQPQIFADMREQVDLYEERQRVLPGITGWAQINHHYDHSVEDVKRKVGFDLQYVAGRSPTKDLEIMLKTVPVMVFKKGAL
jgi:lipopolysaccharide/colanic/teichoic acid biosynthesis glycosyltransferase